MSTRCQIMVKGSPILIYKHCDGYPEGVLPTLEPFAKAFTESRGDDIEYCLAQIIRTFAVAEATDRFTGWGLDQCVHGDIEYFYIVDSAKGTVKVVKGDFDKAYEANKS